jgi:maltose alpha-D-glucosyltransferase/alpha-amylase
MLALPGTPVMWQGDEIGMGERLDLPERAAVRTPMQWSDERHGGFSRTEGDLLRPMAEDGPLGRRETSVADQRGRPGSLLERVREMVRVRRACPEIGWGEWEVLESPDGVLALACRWRGETVVTLHDLSGEGAEPRLSLPGAGWLSPLLSSDGAHGRAVDAGAPVRLAPHGYFWARADGERR